LIPYSAGELLLRYYCLEGTIVLLGRGMSLVLTSALPEQALMLGCVDCLAPDDGVKDSKILLHNDHIRILAGIKAAHNMVYI